MNRNTVRAFTLIEMLVVIAIITILMGLLVPTFFSVQSRAARTKCLSNTRQIAMATVNLFEELGDELPYRSNAMNWGEAAEQLLPYVRNIKDVFDCPANPGSQNQQCKMPSHDFWVDYEMNGYLCSCPGEKSERRRQSMIIDYSLAAYAYDYPYDPNPHDNYEPDKDRAHVGGVNCAYLDGHAAWLADEDMGGLVWPDVGENTFYHKGHVFWKL